MEINFYYWIILFSLCLDYFLNNFARYLDIKRVPVSVPEEFQDYYDNNNYSLSQKYFRDNGKLAFITSSFSMFLILAVIYFSLFNSLDLLIRGLNFSPVISGMCFFAIIFFIQDVLGLPFSIYKTFVIEEKYGFNKTTLQTYILDRLKMYLVICIFGGAFLFGVLHFFEKYGRFAWVYIAIVNGLFMLIMQPIFTKFILPLFNSFTPLEDGKLKTEITYFINKVKFPVNQIDVVDGSKRTTKSNAYFSGLGRIKRIALYDTLIKNHSVPEVVSILAHEIGHYKKNHNIKNIMISTFQMTLLFFLLSLFLNNNLLFQVFGMEYFSIYASLLFFSILYSPINLVLSVLMNMISRKHEYEADAYAKEQLGTGKHLINSLKKLTVTSLGTLNPSQLTIYLHYSHPPILERIYKLK